MLKNVSPVLTPIAVAVGATVTAALVALAFYIFIDREKTLFSSQSTLIQYTLSGRINATEEILHSATRLFNSAKPINSLEFHLFSERILKRHSFLRSIQYLPLVKDLDRVGFEREIRDEGDADYSITEHRDGQYVIARNVSAISQSPFRSRL